MRNIEQSFLKVLCVDTNRKTVNWIWNQIDKRREVGGGGRRRLRGRRNKLGSIRILKVPLTASGRVVLTLVTSRCRGHQTLSTAHFISDSCPDNLCSRGTQTPCGHFLGLRGDETSLVILNEYCHMIKLDGENCEFWSTWPGAGERNPPLSQTLPLSKRETYRVWGHAFVWECTIMLVVLPCR